MAAIEFPTPAASETARTVGNSAPTDSSTKTADPSGYEWPDPPADRTVLLPGDDRPAAATDTERTVTVDERVGESVVDIVGDDRYGGQSWNGDELTVFVREVTGDEREKIADLADNVIVESTSLDYETAQRWVETIGFEVLREFDRPDVLVGQVPGRGVRVQHDEPLSDELMNAITDIVPERHLTVERVPGLAAPEAQSR